MAESCKSAVLLCLAALSAQTETYSRADMLLDVQELAKPEVAKRFRIVDVRSKNEYDVGHVPGAVWIDAVEWGKVFHRDQDPANWSSRLSKLSLADLRMPLVLYGTDVRESARMWWILRYWGLSEVRLLNGGWQAWVQGKGTTDKIASGLNDRKIELAPQAQRLATKEALLKDLKEKRATILDVRSLGEFCGDTNFAKRGGAIPAARHLEWSEVIDAKTERFKSPSELAQLFKEAGIDPARPAVTYCQSGGRASVMAFALELMGARDVRNYYRSWSEWGNADDTPIVKSKKP